MQKPTRLIQIPVGSGMLRCSKVGKVEQEERHDQEKKTQRLQY